MKKSIFMFVVIMMTMILPLKVMALTEGDWEYKIVDNEIIITGYIGNDKVVTMPDTIRGCPVVKIEREDRTDYRFRNIESLTLPDTIREISDHTFENTKLNKINIPKNLEIIGYWAFRECKLTSIDLSTANNLHTIDTAAFYGCPLENVILPDNITYISSACFYGCNNLQNVKLPSSVTSIGEGAFFACDFTGTLIIPPTVKEIHGNAFSRNDNLEEVIISYGTTFVSDLDPVYHKELNNKNGDGAFENCKSLKAIYIPNTVENIARKITLNSDNAIVYCSSTATFVNYLKENEISYLTDNSVNTKIHVLYNGSRVSFHNYNQNPEIIEGRTMVPLRSIFEVMGASVDWNADTRTATATRNGNTVKITIGEKCIYKNGSAIPVDVPAEIMNNRTMIPVRAIAEAFGASVEWDANCKAVLITE